MKGERINIYFDAESLEIIDEMKKSDVNISNICQAAVKGWINKSSDYALLKEKVLSLEKDHEEKISTIKHQKEKIEEKIKKENEGFFSIKNKTLELMGKESTKKHTLSKIKDKFYSNEQGEEFIKELIKDTFKSYINYLFTWSEIKGDEETNPKYWEEFDIINGKFNDKLNILSQKFMKNYDGTFNRDYFKLEIIYSKIKAFVSKNHKDFSPQIFLENKNPNKYYDSELYLYMPLKDIK